MPPGVRGLGGVDGKHERMPLKANFVVDGSGSISAEMWKDQQVAGKKFIEALEKNNGGQSGDLEIGIVQFASTANVELEVTSDTQQAVEVLGSINQMDGGTQYDKALQACRTNLANDDDMDSFKVCVLITDGEDNSGESAERLKQMAGGDDTAIFGIFVGDSQDGQQTLRGTTSCGKAQVKDEQCDFFASAADYNELATKAEGVAAEITKAVDIATCLMTSALIGFPTIVAMCLPYFLWCAQGIGRAAWRRHREGNNGYNNLEIETAAERE